MLNTASYYLAYLKEEDIELKSFALNKINQLIDVNWAEISDFIKDFEGLFESNIMPHENGLIALILSKIYYNLEDYESAIEWALQSDNHLNLSEKSQFVTTILRKIIEKYILQRKNNFFNDDQVLIDPRIQKIVERIFGRCISLGEINQAIGFSFESYDLERVISKIYYSKIQLEFSNLNI
jgi:26S proteasome regulatory subunit N2